MLCCGVALNACQPLPQQQAGWYVRLEHANAWQEAGQVIIDCGIDLHLSPDAEQALHQGIPLYLVADTRIARHHRFWAWLIEQRRYQWRIAYLPLSRQYALTAPGGERNTYSRLRHLRAALREPQRFTLSWPQTASTQRFQVQIRAAIDRQQLPAPLRLPALFSRQWEMRSDWQTWLLGTA